MTKKFVVVLAALAFTLSSFTAEVSAQTPPVAVGVLPLGADGKPLNTDFETGDLRDWTLEGAAFKGQPIKGDIDQKRKYGAGRRSGFRGNFWIGGFELLEDLPKGRLISAPFKVTHPWAAFLIGGGSHAETRVELVFKDGGKVLMEAHGQNSETMLPVVVDLQPHQGKEIFIRIIDEHTDGWGHVNFDDFKFYAQKPAFAESIAANPPGQKPNPLPVDAIKFAGLSPEQAAKEMTLPPGFKATLFAGEPDVKQPIAFAIDDRGRLWVAEAYAYPKRQPEGQGHDRILVFEDTKGDGKFDRRTVFMDNLNLVSGLEVGFGGVWIGAAPYLMFVPIADGDEPKPAGEPKILLDGWDYSRDTHETLNTFTWGPDGWLYGCHGVFCPSHVGKPGTPVNERQRVDAAVWRYHPVKHMFEVFAEGTSNPWGIDFDERGQCFTEACVIPHLFHIIQGARYHRQGGSHYSINLAETAANAPYNPPGAPHYVNPFIYNDIKTIADHVHFAGSGGPHAGNGRSDAAGGGHAHAGLMVYLGGAWPAEYHGKLFMNNIHGARINMDAPERSGSGFIGKHGADFVKFNDSWSQILNLQYDQDGAVYMIDWYDKNQCHHNNVDGHDRNNGRIFKITYGDTRPTKVNLTKLSDDELVWHLFSAHEWQARHAGRVLQERAAAGKLLATTRQRLEKLASLGKSATGAPVPPNAERFNSEAGQLRVLWTLHAIGSLTPETGLKLLNDKSESVRAWTIQLLCEEKNGSAAPAKEFARLAKEDPSPVVRLYLASACQRLSVTERAPIVEALLAHAEDAGDHNLPLMYWYAAEPLVGSDPGKAALLLAKSKIPLVREYITRRLTATKSATPLEK